MLKSGDSPHLAGRSNWWLLVAKQKLKNLHKGPGARLTMQPAAVDIADPGVTIKGLAKGKGQAGRDGAKKAPLRHLKSIRKAKAKGRKATTSPAMAGKAAGTPEVARSPAAAVRALKGLVAAKMGRRQVRLSPLERLAVAIDEVRLGARQSPRTRKLQVSGLPKMAQKVIEEAGEVAIEAIQGNRSALIAESVDLLYNMLVMLSSAGVSLEDLWDEMERRELTLGMAEKLPKAVDPES